MNDLLKANECASDDIHLGERFYSSSRSSHYSSPEGFGSYSVLLSSTNSSSSMNELNFDSFECDFGALGDETFNTTRDFSREPNFFSSCKNDEVETIDRYPSGRKPLIPLKLKFNNNATKKDVVKIEPDDEEVNENMSESLSWFSRTLCAAPTDSTFDSSHQVNDVGVCNDGLTHLFEEEEEKGPEKGQDDQNTDEDERGYGNLSDKENKVETKDSSTMNNLGTFFRRSNILCDTWEDWYNMIDSKNELGLSQTDNRVAHNRSTNMTARKKKIEYLRKNLAPFDMDQIELKEGSINTEKYSPCDHGSIYFSFSNNGKLKTSKRSQPIQSVMDSPDIRKCTPMISRGCGNFRNIDDIPIAPSNEDLDSNDNDDDDLYYDSDPSDLMLSVQSPSRRLQSTSNNQPKSIYDINGKFDDHKCLEKICEYMNSKRVLLWHRPSTVDKIFHPIAVHAWIELGSQLETTLIQPKFCWRKSYEKELHDRSVLRIRRFNAVDLLDISKVVAVSKSIFRGKYPYMQRKSSYVIEAFGQELLFEARNETERDDIVEGLKLLVARLGSKIMMGDGRVLDEFFSPLGATVPGCTQTIF